MTFIPTLVVGAVFIGCGLILISVAIVIVGHYRGDIKGLDSGLMIFSAAFAVPVVIAAYFTGAWLFQDADKGTIPRSNRTNGGTFDLAADYSGTWQSNAPANIIRTLAVNNVQGCGEFHHKPNIRNSGEYLVYCTPDGRTWTSYLVWPNVERVSGPARPDANIEPPH